MAKQGGPSIVEQRLSTVRNGSAEAKQGREAQCEGIAWSSRATAKYRAVLKCQGLGQRSRESPSMAMAKQSAVGNAWAKACIVMAQLSLAL